VAKVKRYKKIKREGEGGRIIYYSAFYKHMTLTKYFF
jgi:hypothetical protein